MGRAPKYFDYLHQHGQYLTSRFDIRCETDNLESDIARYRRRRGDGTYWIPAVYLRRLLEQLVNSFLSASPYEYGKELGKKLHEGIEDGYIPRMVGHKMSALNRLVRAGAHANDNPYTASDLEAAFAQLDVVFRAILQYEGKAISGDKVGDGTDEVLIAHSDTIEEKGSQAALLTGNRQLEEESRAANRRAKAAERDASAARKQAEDAVKKNEQLSLALADAQQTIQKQKVELNRREALYAKHSRDAGSIELLFSKLSTRLDARSAELESSRVESEANLAKVKELYEAKEAFAAEAAEKVSEFEEYLDGILSEHDFINTLLDARGSATDEQRRIVNYPQNSNHKSRFVKVTGKAGTGKTLCLLAAAINYLEPNRQGTLNLRDSDVSRRALFICYNRDLASYITGLLEKFPHLSGRIEVASYNQYLNQLVRTKPIKEYKYLAKYARDVRFQPTVDQNGAKQYWNLIVDDKDKEKVIRRAIVDVRNYYQNCGMQMYCSSSYLNDQDDSNVSWMVDEIEWLEGRYHSVDEGRNQYPNTERVGRGRGCSPRKNSAERTHITNVWAAYRNILAEEQLYTYQQMVTILLQSKFLPTYDIVAIDEAQDLNVLHIELFTRFMTDRGFLLIAGDEGQKVYPRDFSWKEVDSRIKSITLSLSANKRNPVEVQRFAERLEKDIPVVAASALHIGDAARVRCESKESTVAYIKELANRRDETTAVVTTDTETWRSLLSSAGIKTETAKDYDASAETIRMESGGVRPGVYCFSQLKTKGLEFDNVIIDYVREIDPQDVRREKRIRYMQFTRARKTLLVRYEGEPPKLIQDYYPDYIDNCALQQRKKPQTMTSHVRDDA